jgi:hypothetical protein
MDLRAALSAELPTPRDDEPAGLRQDIVDELVDHLACAYNRELLGGADTSEARRRVHERFGDPAAVARRLWLDAMRGKIMAQRGLIVACVVMAAVSLLLAGAMWQQAMVARQLAAAQAAEAAARASQQEMLNQLREVSAAIRTTRSLDWNPVVFTLTEESPDGRPASGFSVSFGETPLGGVGPFGGTRGGGGAVAARKTQGPPKTTTLVSDASGRADFGVFHPGDYFFRIEKGWDRSSVVTFGQLRISPGSQINERIVCPKIPLDRARVCVRVRAAWPADLEKERLVVFAMFGASPIVRDGQSWTLIDRSRAFPMARTGFQHGIAGGWSTTVRSVICGPGTSIAEVLNDKNLYIWVPDAMQPTLRADILTSNLREIKEPGQTISWERATYRLFELYVLRPDDSGGGNQRRREFEIVVASQALGQPGAFAAFSLLYVVGGPPTDEEIDTGSAPERHSSRSDSPILALPREYWSQTAASFEVRSGQVNEWTLPLPEELIQAVRTKLKARK